MFKKIIRKIRDYMCALYGELTDCTKCGHDGMIGTWNHETRSLDLRCPQCGHQTSRSTK